MILTDATIARVTSTDDHVTSVVRHGLSIVNFKVDSVYKNLSKTEIAVIGIAGHVTTEAHVTQIDADPGIELDATQETEIVADHVIENEDDRVIGEVRATSIAESREIEIAEAPAIERTTNDDTIGEQLINPKYIL